MNNSIRLATPEDATAISRLVHGSFNAYVSQDWEIEARVSFLAETTPEKLRVPIAEATFAAVCEQRNNIVGVVLLPRPNLVQLLFVAPGEVHHGVGRSLWQASRNYLEANFPDTKTVELNATPYAVPAYRALGFYPISKPFRRKGSIATRMACWLPGKALEEAANAA